MRGIVLAFAALAIVAPAAAGSTFQPYEGRDSVVDGKGGTRVIVRDTDFWTSGEPNRPYRKLGLLSARGGRALADGRPNGMAWLAKDVRKLGGDAAILMGSHSRETGLYMAGGNVATMSQTSLQLLVIKYLDAPRP